MTHSQQLCLAYIVFTPEGENIQIVVLYCLKMIVIYDDEYQTQLTLASSKVLKCV